MLSRLAIPLLAPLALLCGCSQQQAQGPLVLAAASLQGSLDEVADAWAAGGHPRPVISFAGSSALARQVENGAPADIFLSADEKWMDVLDKERLLRPGTRADLLGNRLVLVAPEDSPAQVDLANPASLATALGAGGRIAIADPDAIPAGIYAKAALTSLGLWGEVSERTAPAENVRAVLALVEAGETPLGVVYATDAKASQSVRVVASFPPSSHPPIRYPVALLAASGNPAAQSFRDFLASSAAQAIFARHGFSAAQ